MDSHMVINSGNVVEGEPEQISAIKESLLCGIFMSNICSISQRMIVNQQTCELQNNRLQRPMLLVTNTTTTKI